MKRIAIVIQRYGLEINGGAELLARLVAQALKPHYQVDVLTSRALDYRRWEPHYPEGEQWLDGVRVLRFDHPPRDRGRRKRMPLLAKLRWKLRRWWPSDRPRVKRPSGDEQADGILQLRAQGPTMDGLMRYLEQEGDAYAALIFVTAMYHPAALGVLVRPERSLLVPNLHDEKIMYLPHFQHVFHAPRAILYNTATEQRVAETLYGRDLPRGHVCGVGIDMPSGEPALNEAGWRALCERHRIDEPYLLYLGRLEVNKGCGLLFDYFQRWRAATGSTMKLVAVGQKFMELPQDPDILFTGFVAEAERDALIEHASAMVIPSRYESLSLVLLEAMARGCPVLVNSACEVLQQHVDDSGVGESFAERYEDFVQALQRTLARSDAQRSEQAAQGRRYVEQRYAWPQVVAKYRAEIEAMPAPRAQRSAA
jgi:glycosyltransferase involved in cell wall biosynthesis